MQSSEQQYFPQKPPGPPLTGQVGGSGYTHNNDPPFPSFFGGIISPPSVKHLSPFQNVDFQPSEICPRNFIIFDQTDNRSQIMYHPALAPKSCYPGGLNIGSPWLLQDNVKTNDVLYDKREISSSFLKEDSDDIDALLSFEEEDEEGEYDEEEVSTARTYNYGSDSADSCSSKPRKSRKLPSSHKSTGGCSSSSCGEKKRLKMRKMVKALRGIVPGSNRQMNTVAVLDEAVRYLKSLKVEVQKFGVGNLKN